MILAENQGFMSLDDEKETSFGAKKWLGSSLRRAIVKALSNVETINNYRSITLNFSNQALQDDIFSILAEIDTSPNDFKLILPPLVQDHEGNVIENPIPEDEREIVFNISKKEYLELTGFKKFFLSHAPGELRRSIHAIGDSIGELAFLEGLKED